MAITNPDYRSADVTLGAAAAIITDGPGAVMTVIFSPDAGATTKTLPVGTPVCMNISTNKWTYWTDAAGAGTNKERVIRGFVYPVPIVLNATGGNDVQAQVFTRGAIKLQFIKDALAAMSPAISTTNLNTALRGHGGGDPSLRELDIRVQDLPYSGL